jgi:hypothetical protein
MSFLYRHVSYWPRHSATGEVLVEWRALETPHWRQMVANHMRVLTVRDLGGPFWEHALEDPTCDPAVALITLAPVLQSLHLRVEHPRSTVVSARVQDLLSKVSPDQLRSLDVSLCLDPAVLAVIGAFVTLVDLTLELLGWSGKSLDAESARAWALPRLRALRLTARSNKRSQRRHYEPHILAFLARCRFPRLQRLTVELNPYFGAGYLEALVGAHPTVEDLAIGRKQLWTCLPEIKTRRLSLAFLVQEREGVALARIRDEVREVVLKVQAGGAVPQAALDVLDHLLAVKRLASKSALCRVMLQADSADDVFRWHDGPPESVISLLACAARLRAAGVELVDELDSPVPAS